VTQWPGATPLSTGLQAAPGFEQPVLMLPLQRCALIEAGDNSAIADTVNAIKKNAVGLLEVMKDGRCIV